MNIMAIPVSLENIGQHEPQQTRFWSPFQNDIDFIWLGGIFSIQLHWLGVHSLDFRNNEVKMARLTGIAMIFIYISKVLF
jgi:hypothetical protein